MTGWGERLRVDVFDNAFGFRGQVADLVNVGGTVRHWERPTGVTISAPPDVDVRNDLTTRGAQAQILLDDEPFVAGWITARAGDLLPGEPAVYDVTGFDTILWDVRGLPVPTAGINDQNVAYWTRRGPAETVVKAALRENTARMGMPVIVAPDQGRGATIDVSLRYHPLIDRMQAQLVLAGIRPVWRLLEGEGVLFDVEETTTHTVALDSESAVLTSGSWKLIDPTLTRVFAGSQGEGAQRSMWGPISAPWEAESWRRIEGFVDARDVAEGEQVDPEQTVDARMRTALDAGGPSTDLAFGLESTDEFAFRTMWQPGDVVPFQPRADVTFSARIEGAQLSIDKGVRVRPVVGGTDDPLTAALNPMLQRVVALGRSDTDQAVR